MHTKAWHGYHRAKRARPTAIVPSLGGMKVWHSPQSPTFDICFVHGLNGDRNATWTAQGHNDPWPKTLLPEKFKTARVLAYGFDSDVVPADVSSLTNTLRVLGASFIRSLGDLRRNSRLLDLPIIFIAHGLGGLICKRALFLAYYSKEVKTRSIASTLLGVVFIATPHAGPNYAQSFSSLVTGISLLDHFTSHFKPTGRPLYNALFKDGEAATDLNEDFVNILDAIDVTINIFSFFEGKPILPDENLLVDRRSADFARWPSEVVGFDHASIVKIQSRDDPLFRRLCGIIDEFLSSERAKSFPGLPAFVNSSQVYPLYEFSPSAAHIPRALRVSHIENETYKGIQPDEPHQSPRQDSKNRSPDINYSADQQPVLDQDSASVATLETVPGPYPNPQVAPSTVPSTYGSAKVDNRSRHVLAQPGAIRRPARGETQTEADERLIGSMYDLAVIYHKYGRYHEALELLEDVVEHRQQTLPETDESLLNSQYSLASAYEKDGQSEKAMYLLEHVIQVRQKLQRNTNERLPSGGSRPAVAGRNALDPAEIIETLEHDTQV